MHMGLIAISGMCYDHKDEILLLLGGGPGAEDSGRGSETTSEKESKVAK